MKDIIGIGGRHIIRIYGSTINMLRKLYPDYEWLPWKFKPLPISYWGNIKNQKMYVEWVKNKKNLKSMEDFYQITQQELSDGADFLYTIYNGYPSLLLANVYPDYNWMPWKFTNSPTHPWFSSKIAKQFTDWASGQLGIINLSDWYKVSVKVSSFNNVNNFIGY